MRPAVPGWGWRESAREASTRSQAADADDARARRQAGLTAAATCGRLSSSPGGRPGHLPHPQPPSESHAPPCFLPSPAGVGLRLLLVGPSSGAPSFGGLGCAGDRFEFVEAAAGTHGDGGEWFFGKAYWESGFGLEPLWEAAQ